MFIIIIVLKIAQANGPDGVLTPISRAIGIEGRHLTAPPIPQLGFNGPTRIPYIHIILAGVITVTFGVRAGLIASVLYLFSLRQQ